MRGFRVIRSATRVAAKSRTRPRPRRRSPSVKMPRRDCLRRPPRSCPCPCRSFRRPHRRASHRAATIGSAAPMRMTSRTWVSNRRPSAPPGWERAKSSTENPRASSTVSASASPSASAAVVLAVGASPSGQASVSTLASRCTSAACASDECSLPVSAISLAPCRFRCGSSDNQLVGLAGVRQQQHDVVGGDHAQVAVARFGGVDEECRRAGRRQCRGELARDVAGLADAGHDDATAAFEDRLARRRRRHRQGELRAAWMAVASVASTLRPSASARSRSTPRFRRASSSSRRGGSTAAGVEKAQTCGQVYRQ